MNSEKNVLEISLTLDYCRNWNNKDALREIIANAIDTKSNVNVEYDESTNQIIVSNSEGLLTRQNLLLGGTTKKNKNTIGTFGEGLKIGALVLIRNGVSIYAMSGKLQYEFSLGYSKNFESKILMVQVSDLVNPIDGTKVFISGLDKETMDSVKNNFLHFRNYNILVTDEDKNEIIDLNDSDKKHIFIHGVKVESKAYMYSYNLNSLKPNRDRQVYDRTTLDYLLNTLVQKDQNVLTSLILNLVGDINRNYYEHVINFHVMRGRKTMWNNIIKSLWGKYVVIKTNDTASAEAKEKGYKVLNLYHTPYLREILKSMIKTDIDVILGKDSEYFPYKGKLTKQQKTNLELAKQYINNIFPNIKFDEFKFKIFTHQKSEDKPDLDNLNHEMEILHNTLKLTRGYYSHNKNEIGLRLSILNDVELIINVLYHEYAHSINHYDDMSRGFEHDLIKPIIDLIINTNKNKPIDKPVKQKPNTPIYSGDIDKVRIRRGNILLPFNLCKKLGIKPNHTGNARITLNVIE